MDKIPATKFDAVCLRLMQRKEVTVGQAMAIFIAVNAGADGKIPGFGTENIARCKELMQEDE